MLWLGLSILYRENPKDSTKRLLELINKFSKVAVYKINIQKSVAFLYTNNELSEKDTDPIQNCFKKNEIPKDKFNQGCKRMYLENYKKPLKKIQISGSMCLVHGVEELTSLKCPYYPKQPIDST